MRLLRSPICGIALTALCYISHILAVPSLFRRQASKPQLDHSSESDVDLLKLDPVDQLAIFGDSAKTHDGQECYAQIYDQVKAGCAGDSDFTPGERMLASVLLTLCDLRASNQSVPWECNAARETQDQASVEPCIEALSRSTRYWSSYAGYLREVPRMCFALQRWRDTDHAREIYKAATREKIALIRLWRQKVEESAEAGKAERLDRQSWFQNLSLLRTQMQDDLKDIMSSFRAFLSTQQEIEQGVTHAVDSLESSLKQAAAVLMEEYKDTVQRYSEELSLQLQHVVEQHGDQLQHATQQYLRLAADLLETELTAPVQNMKTVALDLGSHTDALGAVLKDQQDLLAELSSASTGMLSLQRLHGEQIKNELNGFRQIRSDFQMIGEGMNATQHNLDTLLKSQGLGPSFSVLSGAIYAVERLLVWSVGSSSIDSV